MLHLWHRENCVEITAVMHLNQGKLQQTYLVTSSNEARWVIFPFLYSTRQITFQFYKQISQLYFNKRNIFWFNFFPCTKTSAVRRCCCLPLLFLLRTYLSLRVKWVKCFLDTFRWYVMPGVTITRDFKCCHLKKNAWRLQMRFLRRHNRQRQARTHGGSLLPFIFYIKA